nr:hypothetical protein Q903MT_gene2700 [Picea sitchensis]
MKKSQKERYLLPVPSYLLMRGGKGEGTLSWLDRMGEGTNRLADVELNAAEEHGCRLGGLGEAHRILFHYKEIGDSG